MSRSGSNIVPLVRATVRLWGPSFSSTATQSTIGPSNVRMVVDLSTGIDVDSYDQDLLLKASSGGAISVGGLGVGASGITVDADANPVNVGTVSADAVTLGNSSGGTVTAVGAVALGTEASNTVTVGGSGSSAVTIAAASGDALTLGASGATVQMGATLSTSGGTDIGSAGARFGTVWTSSLQATSATITNLTFESQVLSAGTTVFEDESSPGVMVGTPTVCKALRLDVAAMRALGQFAESGTTTYYPLQWTDPRGSDSSSEQIASLSANVQIYDMMMVLSEAFPSVPSSATFNLVHAPQATALRADFAGVGSCDSNSGQLRVQVADTAGLTRGDAVVVTGFATAAHNGRATITQLEADPPRVTLSTAFAAVESAAGATFAMQSQFTAWSADIQDAAAVAVSSPDIVFSDVKFDEVVMGHIVKFASGPFPLYSSTDATDDNYFGVRITTSTQPTSGKMDVHLFSVSIGGLA